MSDPVLIAYGVHKRGDGKYSWWRRIGEAFPHEQGSGLTIVLDLLPLDGRIVLLERDAADDERLERLAKGECNHPLDERAGHDE